MVIEHFLIHSPWEEVDADDGKTEIILDPGVVFGTGLYPTTEDCLKAMAHLHGQSPLRRGLDLGTGTGSSLSLFPAGVNIICLDQSFAMLRKINAPPLMT